MHIPTLGTYPLVLRDYDVTGARDGEFLLNYSNYDLYYIKRSTSTLTRMANDIYKRILEAKVQNSKFITYDYDKESEKGGLKPVDGTTLNLETASHKRGVVVIPVDSKSEVDNTTLLLDISDYIFPPIADREYNAFYYIIEKRAYATSKRRTTILDISTTTDSYVINDVGEKDVDGHIVVVMPLDIVEYQYKNTLFLDIDIDEIMN